MWSRGTAYIHVCNRVVDYVFLPWKPKHLLALRCNCHWNAQVVSSDMVQVQCLYTVNPERPVFLLPSTKNFRIMNLMLKLLENSSVSRTIQCINIGLVP